MISMKRDIYIYILILSVILMYSFSFDRLKLSLIIKYYPNITNYTNISYSL